MEFLFNCEKLLGADAEGFAIIDGKKNVSQFLSTNNRAIGRAIPELQQNLYEVIDKMGAASSKAQGLPAIITSSSRLFTSDNRLYLKVEGNKVIGLLKVGVKKLFIRNESGSIKEISPLCVLDFYVHESVQRGGFGKQLFEKMLENEGVKPERFGYDRPSEKLLGFLAKHYGLKKYIPQNNNYVVFSAYFDSSSQLQNLKENVSTSNDTYTTTYGGQMGGKQNGQNRAFGGQLSQTAYNANSNPSKVQQQQLQQQQYQQQQNQIVGGGKLKQQSEMSQIFGTQTNFSSQQKQQQQIQNVKPGSKQSSNDNQLSNAGLQMFGGNQRSGGLVSSSSNKRSQTLEKQDSFQYQQQEYQKENSYRNQQQQQQQKQDYNYQQKTQYGNNSNNMNQSQQKFIPKDSVGSLISGFNQMTLKDQNVITSSDQQEQKKMYRNANEFRLSKYDNKLEETEQKIKKNQEILEKIEIQNNQQQMSQRPPTHSKGSAYPSAPYANSQNDNQKTSGPTSMAALDPYNKRNQYAVLNNDVTKRYNDNQQFVQFQKQFNSGSKAPWGYFNNNQFDGGSRK